MIALQELPIKILRVRLMNYLLEKTFLAYIIVTLYVGPKIWNSITRKCKKHNSLNEYKEKKKTLVSTHCLCKL